MDNLDRLVIVTGPTATGKTKLALELARSYSGELVSADSRQVYRFMDIGTGKDIPKFSVFNLQFSEEGLNFGFYEIAKVKIWGLDIVEPDYKFNVARWVNYATRVIKDIRSRHKLPIVVGGSGQYIYSLLNPSETIDIPIDRNLREELDRLPILDLQQELAKIDRNRWETLNRSDRNNPRRLVRAIEVASQRSTNKETRNNQKFSNLDAALIIGLTAERDVLNERIDRRVDERMALGMVDEVQKLLAKGYSWNLPSMSGIGYREFKENIGSSGNNIDIKVANWKTAEHQYAKKQLTYLKKYFPDAKWFDIAKPDYQEQIRSQVETLLKSTQ